MKIFARTISVILLMSSTTSAKAFPASILWEGGRLRFVGTLDGASAERLSKELKKSPSVLLITSQGGVGSSAIDVGQIIKAKSIPVLVVDYCLSACANGIFLASPQPMILGAGVVGFHGSAVAEVYAYRAAEMPVPAQEQRWEGEYRQLFEGGGDGIGLLECAARMIEFGRYRLTVPASEPGGKAEGWSSRYWFWVPDDADFEKFGFKVSRVGRPPGEDERRIALERAFGERLAEVKFGLDAATCP